jgi:hypothetical protein
LEVEAGWRSGDDLSWVAQELGRYWLRNLDPVVHELSADGVRAWHHAVNAPGTLRSGDRQEARIILAGVLALREEIARTPSLEPYGFWLDKTRALADRLVHIEGMNPSLKPATPIVM